MSRSGSAKAGKIGWATLVAVATAAFAVVDALGRSLDDNLIALVLTLLLGAILLAIAAPLATKARHPARALWRFEDHR